MNSETQAPETLLRQKAKSLGFIKIGFTLPGCPPFFNSFEDWVSQKRYGDMDWITRHVELRKNPQLLLKGCKTIISLAYPYSGKIPTSPDGLRAARYTQGLEEDYHSRLKRLAKVLADLISEIFPGARSRICVDSAPVLERSIAYTAGLGFFGKNTMLIIPDYGSYFYLLEIFTTAAIPFKRLEPIESKCGQCTKCLDACPTGALSIPYTHHSESCLSYLTIEWKGQLKRELARSMGRCFLGCDVCQEVCPFNKMSIETEIVLPTAREILEMNETGFQRVFGNTAFARPGLNKIKSNVRVALLQ